MNVQIPASLDEAKSALNGLGALLTAKQWERAAIVYAFTEPGNGQGTRTDAQPHVSTDARLSIAAFSRLGINGLSTEWAVRSYRSAWQSAIDDGQAVPVGPGDAADLPSLPWKDHFGEPTRDVQERIFRSVVRDPEQFRSALRDAPDIAEAVAQRVVELPSTRTLAEAKLAEPIRERESPEPRPEPKRDLTDDALRGVSLLVPVLRAIQRGEWQPSPAVTMLFHALGQLLQETRFEGAAQDDLFAQIERHMREGVR